MKLLHTGDLHIGKKIHEVSLAEDQKHMLQQIYDIAVEKQVDVVLLAGDIYDRSVPGTEAVELLDEFLTKFVQQKIPVVMISGNHDSPERVSFADKILEQQGLYIAGNYEGKLRRVEFEDEAGVVSIVCLPFIKPARAGGKNCAEAVANVLEKEAIDFTDGKRYILLTHYFVTGEGGFIPQMSESESSVDVGGIDNVPARLFDGFSYVALGHIHKRQQVGSERIWYAGAPMKYSFSEAGSEKSVNVVQIDDNGKVGVDAVVLRPLHEMRCIKGKLADLIQPQIVNDKEVSPWDYIQATLTNQEELVDPIGTLRSVYPNTLQILMEKHIADDMEAVESCLRGKQKKTEELFADFYEMLTGEVLNEKQWQVVCQTVKEGEEA